MKRSGGFRGLGLCPEPGFGAWWMGIPQPSSPPARPLILPHPHASPPRGDEQAHYYGVLIKGGHYLLTVHFELSQKNLPLPVSSSGLCNAVIGGSLPMFAEQPWAGIFSKVLSWPHTRNSRFPLNHVYLYCYPAMVFLSTDLRAVADGIQKDEGHYIL